jgi:predicted XRE-type DNA-binding protein
MRLLKTGSDQLKLATHPSSMLGLNQSLTFTYPIIIDDSLQKYANDIRNFFTLQLISQIKTANLLNITAQATKAGITKSNTSLKNVADQLNKSLIGTSPAAVTTNDIISKLISKNQQDEITSQISKYEYEAKIKTYYEFIGKQLKNDPQYNKLNPIISSITVENLIDVPLIVGTKMFTFNTVFTYWLFYLSAGYNLKLNNTRSLEKIKKTISQIPSQKYNEFLTHLRYRTATPAAPTPPTQSSLEKLVQNTNSNLNKNIAFLSIVLNETMWNDEIGVNSSTTAISSAIAKNASNLATSQRKAFNLFASFYSNVISSILISFANLIVSTEETKIADQIKLFTESLFQRVESFYTYLGNVILSVNNDYETTIDMADNLMKQSLNMCEENTKFDIQYVFANIKSLEFSLTNTTHDAFLIFTQGLSKMASQLTPISRLLFNNLYNLSGRDGRVSTQSIDFVSFLVQKIDDFFYEGRDPLIPKATFGTTITMDIEKQARLIELLGLSKPSANTTLNNKIRNAIKNYIENLKISLAEITTFLIMYSYFSYYCEYLVEISADIFTTKRDALSFPNYCLVVPSFVIERVFMALAVKNFENDLKENNTDTAFSNFSISESDTLRMLKFLNERLDIPNIVVIDEQSKKIFYKWMYMKNPVKLNLSNLTSYIESQSKIV